MQVDAPAEEQGPGTIAGAAGGTPFTHVAAAFVIDGPESDATTVVYLFSNPVRCLDLSFSAWDRAVSNGTLVLELKLLGTAPGTFLVVTGSTLSVREAAVEWMRTSVDPPPVEVRSKGGFVRLETLSTSGPATGAFSLDFGASRLTGTFMAALARAATSLETARVAFRHLGFLSDDIRPAKCSNASARPSSASSLPHRMPQYLLWSDHHCLY